MKRSAPDPRAAAKRAALNALRRAERAAAGAGIDLSAWEGEFLGSVAQRVKTYGRAFGDPEKGAAGQALSVLQGVKLKEITAKAKGKSKYGRTRRILPPLHGEGPAEGQGGEVRRALDFGDDPEAPTLTASPSVPPHKGEGGRKKPRS